MEKTLEKFIRVESHLWNPHVYGHASVQRLVLAGYGPSEEFVRVSGVQQN